MPSRNHTVIETEKKFRCTNIDKLIAHAVSLGFNQIQENGQEHDIYFTDKEQLFITQRICLRIRQTENQCEITYKGDSHDTEALYSKLETNIKISYDNKGHAITLLESLGFMRYVDVKKTRNLYRKDIGDFRHHIAIDYIQNAGYFIEFEILSEEAKEKNQIQKNFTSFLELFSDFDLQEEKLPYRDIVKKLNS